MGRVNDLIGILRVVMIPTVVTGMISQGFQGKAVERKKERKKERKNTAARIAPLPFPDYGCTHLMNGV